MSSLPDINHVTITTSTSNMSLLGLSNELLDRIFENCDTVSVKSLRLSNRRLRNLGNRHLIRELRLYYNYESINLLDTLATTHQDIAKGIRAIWIQSDELTKFSSYASWNIQRERQYGDEGHMYPSRMLPCEIKRISAILNEDWFREAQQFNIDIVEVPRPEVGMSDRVGKIAKEYLHRRYACYTRLYAEQSTLDSSDTLREKFAALFRVCPKLRKVWITSDGVVRMSTTYRSTSFRKGSSRPLKIAFFLAS